MQYVVMFSSSYSSLTWAIPLSKTNITHTAKCFPDRWIILFHIRAYLDTEIGPQFVSKFFAFISVFLRSNTLQQWRIIWKQIARAINLAVQSRRASNTTSPIAERTRCFLWNTLATSNTRKIIAQSTHFVRTFHCPTNLQNIASKLLN